MKINIEQEYEDAHQDYIYRKDEIITKLKCIRDAEIENNIMRVWVNQAIEFINEKEV
jgi:hypothetical protein